MADRDHPTRHRLRTVRLIIWTLVGVAAIGFAFLFWRSSIASEPAIKSMSSAEAGVPGFTLGGPFTLTGADGKRFASSTLAGQPYVMFFGFTHCPDVCPTTLARLARLKAQSGSDALRIVFISVDPQRDTPAALRDYAGLFDTPSVMLTGTPDEIAKVAKQHAVYFAKVPSKDAPDGYTMDHSAAALLFDKAGTFVATISPEETDEMATAKLKRVV